MASEPTPAPGSRASHIRSFAKDVASLTGKAPKDMAPSVAPPPVPIKVEEKKPEPPAPPKLTPLPEPPPLPSEPVREEILARLKERAAQGKAPAPDAAPIPLAAKPPVPPKAAPIHTYKSDFADRIDDKSASVFSVLAAEKDAAKQETVKLKENNIKNLRLYLIGGMFVFMGIGALYAAFRWANDLSVIPTEEAVPSLVFADSRRELVGSGPSLRFALAEAAEEQIPAGHVMITYITTSTTTDRGAIKFPQTGGALIRALDLPAPSILLRNVADESTVGIINSGEEARAFFIFRVLSYERTFGGMLEWEATMAQDLGTLYPSYVDEVSPETTVTVTAPPRFVDDVVASRDVRVLKDYRDRTILLYGYRDKATLLIARDEAAFSQLIERLVATDTR